MAEFHFVDDYVRLVRKLMEDHPIDEAMSLAVGGSYELHGRIQADLLQHLGLRDGMTIVDYGCGSGRLAHALSSRVRVRYAGLDIVEELLAYARSKSPPHYAFRLHRGLSLPIRDGICDFIVAFSVFTHLLPTESFIYLREMRRALTPGGRAVFSFLEFAEPAHWQVFEDTVAAQENSALPHLNSFLERGAIELWADKLGLEFEQFIDAPAAPWGGQPLGQSVAVLRKPAPG